MEAWGYIGTAYLLAAITLLGYQVRTRRRLTEARRVLARMEGRRRP